MHVLIGNKAKQLVLDDRSAQRSTQIVAVQLRHLLVRRNRSILLEEKGRSIPPVGAATEIRTAVQVVGSG